ncbi:hypothetical protein, partial [Parafilimonas sp.]|uniref:hypothetical protein n=1 Tax=Parafilimonas sp. TaxID=1969739 RepID=UPI0039E4432E
MEWKEQLLQARERYMIEHYAACKDFGVPSKYLNNRWYVLLIITLYKSVLPETISSMEKTSCQSMVGHSMS